MTPRLSFCLPFYNNAAMLAEQYRIWSAYPSDLKDQIEIVIVEDGTPAGQQAVSVPRPGTLPKLRIYRLKDEPAGPIPPWRQHAARNRAAYEAGGEWLFLTDMDHVIPEASLRALFEKLKTASPDDVHTFHRVDAPKLTPTKNDRGEPKPHCNTFAMTKAKYWKVGGYDEDAVGYGTDSYFRRRLYAQREAVHLTEIPIIRYPREVIADASTCEVGIDPRALRNRGRRSQETKERLRIKYEQRKPIKVLSYETERVL